MTVATRPNGRVSVHVRDAVHSDDEALRAIQQRGDWEEWVTFFASAVNEGARA